MKRAVAQLENYLDRIEGHTKGKVVIATVFGDVHDIGKSLVNTILTNNGYTVIDLGKQVPVDTIINAALEHEADAIGLSALLVSTSKQMPTCVQELHNRGLEFPVKVLGNGEAVASLTISAHAFSESARAAIEAAGGTATVLERTDRWMTARPRSRRLPINRELKEARFGKVGGPQRRDDVSS